MNIEQLISENKGTIIDVRTREEYISGNPVGSINIPLQEVVSRLDEVKSLPQPLILCCASGNRSGMVEQFLSQNGIECCNAGSWLDVNYYQSKNVK